MRLHHAGAADSESLAVTLGQISREVRATDRLPARRPARPALGVRDQELSVGLR
jgi:hypothetical protein